MILKKKTNGFILVTIMVILGFTFFLFDKLINSAILFSTFSNTCQRENQARYLIFSSISIVFSKMLSAEDGQLNSGDIVKVVTTELDKTDKNGKFEISIDDRLRSFLFYTIPVNGIWQTFNLEEKTDGIDAKIQVCLTCEEGKLFLPDAFDFKENNLTSDYKKLLQNFKIENVDLAEGNFEKNLALIAKKNPAKKLYDLSQMNFGKYVEFFYRPTNLEKDGKGSFIQKVFLSDIFTLYSSPEKQKKLHPFFLSQGVLSIIKIPQGGRDRSSKEFLDELKKELKKISYSSKPNENFNFIENLYQKNDASTLKMESENNPQPQSEDGQDIPLSLKSLTTLFTEKIEPEFFTLFCRVNYQDLQKEAVIIFKRKTIEAKYNKKNDDKSEKPEIKEENQKKPATLKSRSFFLPKDFEIIRFYWL